MVRKVQIFCNSLVYKWSSFHSSFTDQSIQSQYQSRPAIDKNCQAPRAPESKDGSKVCCTIVFVYYIADKNLYSKLPCFPPKINLPGLGNCCDTSKKDAFIDHAKDYHNFQSDVLAWAIQNKVDSKCIERYMDKCDPVLLHAKLSNVIKVPGEPSFPILYLAVERNSPEIVSMLCRAGADPSQKYDPLGMPAATIPLLAYAVMRAECDLSDTTDLIVALVAKGADPNDVPRDMWQKYLKAPVKDTAEPIDPANSPHQWCTQEIREILCRNLTLLQRHIL